MVLTSLTTIGSRACEYSKNLVISAISWFGQWWIGITPTSAADRNAEHLPVRHVGQRVHPVADTQPAAVAMSRRTYGVGRVVRRPAPGARRPAAATPRRRCPARAAPSPTRCRPAAGSPVRGRTAPAGPAPAVGPRAGATAGALSTTAGRSARWCSRRSRSARASETVTTASAYGAYSRSYARWAGSQRALSRLGLAPGRNSCASQSSLTVAAGRRGPAARRARRRRASGSRARGSGPARARRSPRRTPARSPTAPVRATARPGRP